MRNEIDREPEREKVDTVENVAERKERPKAGFRFRLVGVGKVIIGGAGARGSQIAKIERNGLNSHESK